MLEKVLIRNFLSRNSYSAGVVVSLFILLLCYLTSTIYWNDIAGLDNYLAANPQNVFADQEYWRLVTTLFVHGDLKHLLSNSMLLMVMSYYVYSHYGAKVYPFLSLLMGALVNLLVLASFEHNITLVGISGVVYFLWGFWLYLFVRIQRHIPLYRRFMKVLIVGSALLIPEVFEANVSHLAHYLGLFLGVINGACYFMVYGTKIRRFEEWESVLEEPLDASMDYVQTTSPIEE